MKKLTGLPIIYTALVATMLLGGCNKTNTSIAPQPAASAVAGNVSDTDISGHVKTALLQSSELKRYDIAVVTLKGDVRLSGTVDRQSQIDEALKIARAAEGAHAIHNELVIKK